MVAGATARSRCWSGRTVPGRGTRSSRSTPGSASSCPRSRVASVRRSGSQPRWIGLTRLRVRCNHLVVPRGRKSSGRCSGRRHHKNPASAITCTRCVRQCARCGVVRCSTCTRIDSVTHASYCRGCYRLIRIGRFFCGFFGFFLGLLAMLFIERTDEPPLEYK